MYKEKIEKFWYDAQHPFYVRYCEPEVLEKFAELLIKNIIDEISQYHSSTINAGFIPENPTNEHYEEWGYIKGINCGYNDAVEQIVDGLSTYYGIK